MGGDEKQGGRLHEYCQTGFTFSFLLSPFAFRLQVTPSAMCAGEQTGQVASRKLTGLTVTGERTMNIAMWVVAGGVLGWIGFAILNANKERGMVISVIIGVLGGFFGGNVLAPMLGAVTYAPNDFSLFSLTIALASAAACLAISNLLSRRMGV